MRTELKIDHFLSACSPLSRWAVQSPGEVPQKAGAYDPDRPWAMER